MYRWRQHSAALRHTLQTSSVCDCAVATIHQPSIDVFESFDEMLLLKRGGQTIYAGAIRVVLPTFSQRCSWDAFP